MWVMPDEHAVVLLEHWEHPQGKCAVGPVRLVRDVSVGAVRAPAPAVERALDAVTDDLAAVADVRAEVFAVRFEYMQLTALVALGHQLLAEVLKRSDFADRKLGGHPTMNHPVTFQVNGTFTPAPLALIDTNAVTV